MSLGPYWRSAEIYDLLYAQLVDYDANGRQKRMVLPGGGTIDRVFDELGRVQTVVTPTGDRVEQGYDAAGRLTSIQQPGRGTRRPQCGQGSRTMPPAIRSPVR